MTRIHIPIWVFAVLIFSLSLVGYISYKTIRPKIQFNSTSYTIELALTDDEKKKGLSNRDSMPLTHGMLFVYPVAEKYDFWMKGMRFPLDFVWLRDKTVVDITPNVQPDNGPEYRLYHPDSPANMILELNAGEAAKAGIVIGQQAVIRFK